MDFFEPGFVLDDFELGPVLQEGALARIHRATDRLTGDTVVLKIPFKDILNNPLLFYHHQVEDQALQRLAHEHIIRRINRRRSCLYLALEWIEGPDLKAVLQRQGPRPIAQVVAWAGQIAAALSHMHARGVHHLDIKPENILVAPDGRVKIVDFGLSWLQGTRDLLSEDFDNPHGTPDYAAPEQLRGVRDDRRSDIYSLGLVLYEMLTGAFPFKRSQLLSEVRKRARIDPVPPRNHKADFPAWLEDIILTALAAEPEKRFSSAAAIGEALSQGASGGRFTITRGDPAPSAETHQPEDADTPHPKPQLLGAITDDPRSDVVVDVLRREAFQRNGEITLLTVNAEMDDSDYIRYATAVEGAKLGRRLEGYMRQLREHGFDPFVRIRKGQILDTILATTRDLAAELLVVGPTRRRGFKKLFGGRLVDRIIDKAKCPVIVASAAPREAPPPDVDPVNLSREDHLAIDFFLHDNWVHHLNRLAAVSRPYPLPEGHEPREDDGDCPLDQWLEDCRRKPEWRTLVRELVAKHRELHGVTDDLAAAARREDWTQMRELYLTTALPGVCAFHQALRNLSQTLKAQTASRQISYRPLTQKAVCPLGAGDAPTDSSLAALDTIRDYFCRHPEASPEACLVHLHDRPIAPPVDTGKD
jgi:serine/threonine protein kinase